jgi:hypothetical protein
MADTAAHLVDYVLLVEALDEADRGELVDGPEAIAKQRRRVLGAR